MTRIPITKGSVPDTSDSRPDIVIIQDSIRQEPGHSVRSPSSSTSCSETLVIPPEEEQRDSSTAIRLGVTPVPDQPAALPTGISSTNKFTLVEEIGRGGMGIILRGRDKVLHRDVALKVIRNPGDDLQRERFIKEAQVTGQLEHPNIVPVHEFGVDQGGRIFFAMKLVRGRTLGEVLAGHRAADATILREFPLSRLVSILVQVCHAVAFAHARGVIHRDIKPANVMLGDFGEVQLMDWGLAKVGGADDVLQPAALGEDTRPLGDQRAWQGSDETRDGAVLGTPVYMPPEQALGHIAQLDARSDVYALGAVLYEVLTLRTPVEGDDVKEVLLKVVLGEIKRPEQTEPGRDIPRDLSAVAMKALSRDPEQRYPDVATMRRDLERFLDGRMVSAREDTVIEVLARFIRRHRVISLVIGIAGLLLLSVATAGYLANDVQRRRAETLQKAAEENQAHAIASSAVAEVERQRAITAQQQAEEQRRIADLARERANTALVSESRLRQRSELTAHQSALYLASEQIARRDYDAARSSLDSCPVHLRDWAWRRLALLCQRHLSQFNDHVGAVRYVAVGDSGRLVATAGVDRSVVVSDLTTRQRIAEFANHTTAMAMGQECALLVVAQDDRVRVFDARTAQELGRLPLRGITAIAMTANGSHAVLGDSDGVLWRWDIATGQHHADARLSTAVTVLAVDANLGLVAGTRTGVIATRADGSKRWVCDVSGRVLAVSSQGLALVLDEANGGIGVVDSASGTTLAQVSGNHSQVVGGVFSEDGQRFALFGNDRSARVFTSVDASPVISLEGHAGSVFAAEFTDGFSRLVTGSADGSVRLWDATSAIDVRQLAEPGKPSVIGHDVDGVHGLIARTDGAVRAIRMLDRHPAWEMDIGFTPLAATNAASSVVLAGVHGQVRVLDLRSGDVVAEHGLGTERLQAIVSDAPASRLVALDEDGWLRGIDRASGSRFAVRVIPSGKGALWSIDDGRQVLAAGSDGAVSWCSTVDGAVIRRETTPIPAITALASRDGVVVALAGDEQVLLWNSITRQAIATLRGHVGTVNDISFNRDGSRLITASQDGTVRLWDALTGRALLVLDAHAGGVQSARLIGDDRELLTVGRDGRVLGWLALDQQSWD